MSGYAHLEAANIPALVVNARHVKNVPGRLHKLLDDAGVKLGWVVADIDGVSARRMVEELIAGQSPGELATLGLGPLKDKREALEGELSPRHCLILKAAHRHIRYLEDELAALDRYLIEAMQPYAWAWQLMTLPASAQPSAWPRGPRFALVTTRVRVSIRAPNKTQLG